MATTDPEIRARKQSRMNGTGMLDQIAVILVEPQSPGNLGMVSRAMKNMGLKDLRVVKGCRIDHPDAFKFAVSARDVLLGATRFDSLEQALSDTVISIATTRR